ncbi:Tetraspanin family-domain-containing protein [Helicostylum pulchrum]|uniref:Tetraspanin family-domain-containing protein n=1 Tax=Helicostylum pulchrum TaxID=562976 RepID=A0ABP9XY14_9FUNG|nr:Tetraspanin family-domain-containing protein [Helicostylum pulchrum]
MTNCCARLSKVYMITTNLLFACLGIAFIAFGLIGMQDKFMGATLFPANTFKLLAILGAVICIASIFGIIGAYVKKNMITYVYMVIIIGALVFQVMIGIKIYQKAANSSQYLIDIWPKSTISYRYNLQEQFDCCGFQTVIDKFVESDVCKDASNSIDVKYPCAPKLQNYIKVTFGKLYLVLFAALALELLAMSNAITLLCSGPITDDDEEDERRKRRKSGIRLDDMSVDTPTTVGSYQQEEQKNYYAGGATTTTNTGNGTQNTYTNHEEPNRNNRYDSYDMYRHNNNSNSYSDNYNGNTINNNRHGNGTAYY